MKKWTWVLLLLGCLWAGCRADDDPAPARVKELVAAIVRHQMPDGALRMTTTGNEVAVIPDVANLTVYALLEAADEYEELRGVVQAPAEAYLVWFATQATGQGVAEHYQGTLDGYVAEGELKLLPGTAASYLLAAGQYQDQFKRKFPEIVGTAAAQAAQLLKTALENDDPALSAARPSARLELALALRHGAELFRDLGRRDLARELRRTTLNSGKTADLNLVQLYENLMLELDKD